MSVEASAAGRYERDLAPAGADAIVVGHDGSSFARQAFRSALELAQALGKRVVVVRSWSIDSLPPGVLMKDGYVASTSEINDEIGAELQRDIELVHAEFAGVDVQARAVLGQPAEVLLKVSSNAHLLIVGSRGRGGFASLLLGSVSEQCVRHASCPVLVMRPTAH